MLLAHAEMRLTDLEYHYSIYKVAYLIITTLLYCSFLGFVFVLFVDFYLFLSLPQCRSFHTGLSCEQSYIFYISNVEICYFK